MNDLVLREEELPSALREWLASAEQAAQVVLIERLTSGEIVLRGLPDVSPELLARVRVTISKYHEALMNLT